MYDPTELNPKDKMQKAGEKATERMKQGEELPPSPLDRIRIEKLEQFKKGPVAFLELAYINDSLSNKELQYFSLLLRAKVS